MLQNKRQSMCLIFHWYVCMHLDRQKGTYRIGWLEGGKVSGYVGG